MQFFTSANDLKEWVRHQGTADVAAYKCLQVTGSKDEKDILETCKNIFEGDENASNILFGILSKYNLTQIREGKMTKKIIKEAQMMRQDSVYGNMDMRICPKLPFSVGKRLISTYNCRHYCLDSMVFDDDPSRVYCAEALWRRHVMDKFAREFKNKEGKWVGGYINERFQTFKDDGGNQMQLAHGERTRLPRPHQYSTESRLSEGRGEELKFNTASSKKFVKLASVEVEKADKTEQMFSDMIEMKEAGLSDEDIICKVADHYKKTIPDVVIVHKIAMKALEGHNGIVYSHDNSSLKKNAQVSLPPRATVRAVQDVPISLLNGQESVLRMGSIVVVEPEAYQGMTVFNFEGNKFVLHEDANATMLFQPLDDDQGMIQEAADEVGLNEGASSSRTGEDFPIEVK